MIEDDDETIRRKIEGLTTEHRDLDAAIAALQAATPVDGLQVQRLKKRKLMLRDQITRLQSQLVPDIIA
ncbi:MAG: DUF465 domain-containing protein [Alphaproteobacteria bacterium]|nr:DUF465 domain-containing protein [Alphaproteobacteria bacterium]